MIPVVVVTMLLVVQIALVGAAKLATMQLARETARTFALNRSSDVGQVTDQTDHTRRSDMGITVQFISPPGSAERQICVEVEFQPEPLLPLFDPLLDDFVVRSEVKMLVEGQ